MAEDATMQINQLETELIEAKVICYDGGCELDEKNKEIEKFRRILEQQKNEINGDSLKKCTQIIPYVEQSKECTEMEEKNKEVTNSKMSLPKLNAEIVNYQEEIAELKRKNKELEQRLEGIKEFQKQITKLRNEIEIIKEENIQLNRKNNEIAHELDEKNKEIEELHRMRCEMGEIIEDIVNYQEETAELKRKNKELEQRHEGIEEFQKQILKLKSEIEIIKEENFQLNRKNNEITRNRARELDDKNRMIEECCRLLGQQDSEISSLKKSNKSCEMEIIGRIEEIMKLTKQKNEQQERSQKRIEEQERQINLLNCRLQENNRHTKMENKTELDEKNKEIEELLVSRFNKLDEKEELERFKRMSQELESELNHLKESSNASLIELNHKNEELQQKHEEMEEFQIPKLRSEIEIIKEENIQLNGKNNEIAHELDEKNKEIDKYINVEKSAKDVDDNENSSVLILGGRPNISTIYLLDSSSQCWKELKITLPKPMHSFGTAIVSGEIYIFGGYTSPHYKGSINGKIYIFGGSRDYEKSCYKLKSDGSWMKLASLNEERVEISNSIVVYFGDIWVIGGSQLLKTVEKYNTYQNKWIQMPELNKKRGDAAAAVFKDKIIVTGGMGDFEYLASAEIFDADLQKWTIFCDLPYPLSSHCMRITNSILTIYGGWSTESAYKYIWEMDINDPEKKWSKKKELKYERGQFGVSKCSNGTVVFGGMDRSNRLDSTEIFDGNNWTEGPKLPRALTDFAFIEIPRTVEERLLKNFS